MNDNASAFASGEYDRKIRQTLPYYSEFYTQITELVKTVYPSAVSWLDVGCGTGSMGKAVLESRIGLNRFVFCDASGEMLRIARERFGETRAEFCACDVRDLRYSGEFDVITAVQVLHYLDGEGRKTALKRCFDALKENGSLITFENFAPFTDTGKTVYLEKWKRYQLAQGRTTEECGKHIARYGKDYFPITPEKHLKLMRECGFGTVEILWLSNMQIGLWGMK